MSHFVQDGLYTTYTYIGGMSRWEMLYLFLVTTGLFFIFCVVLGMYNTSLFKIKDAFFVAIVLLAAIFVITFVTVSAILI